MNVKIFFRDTTPEALAAGKGDATCTFVIHDAESVTDACQRFDKANPGCIIITASSNRMFYK